MAGWTEDRIALLRRLWGEGWSSSKIAKELGGVTRNAVVGQVHRLGLVRGEPEKPALAPVKQDPACAVPGCGKILSAVNTSGLCMAHAHTPDLCRCPRCTGGPVAVRRDATDRPGVRVALVPYPTRNSGVSGLARVSLPREPWVAA